MEIICCVCGQWTVSDFAEVKKSNTKKKAGLETGPVTDLISFHGCFMLHRPLVFWLAMSVHNVNSKQGGFGGGYLFKWHIQSPHCPCIQSQTLKDFMPYCVSDSFSMLQITMHCSDRLIHLNFLNLSVLYEKYPWRICFFFTTHKGTIGEIREKGWRKNTPYWHLSYSWRASPLPLSCSLLTHRIYKVSVSGVAIEQGGLTNLPLSLALRTHKGLGSGVTGRVRVATVFLMPLFSLFFSSTPPPLSCRSSGLIVWTACFTQSSSSGFPSRPSSTVSTHTHALSHYI